MVQLLDTEDSAMAASEGVDLEFAIAEKIQIKNI